ncbi:hypothetical protein JHK82_012210 [Glycine max]|nr:hypothetical protein JHK82_012210 [Glycine max]
MKVSKDYLNFQPCTLEGAEANKWRWFERCIGALDGTHIPVTVSPDERPRYRNRKGDGDGGWKRSALNAAAAVLSTSFNVNVTSDNVKNRIKLWKSWYDIVSGILGQSEFDWDDTKHMIAVENENAWNEYCTIKYCNRAQ